MKQTPDLASLAEKFCVSSSTSSGQRLPNWQEQRGYLQRCHCGASEMLGAQVL
jgi:hypothetical protein